MNILHVTPYFAPAWAYGGPPRSVFELGRELVRRGHSVTVVTTDACDARRRAEPLQEVIDGVDVHRFKNLSNRIAWSQQLFLPRGVGRFLRTCLRDVDVVHLHMYRNILNMIVHREARRFGTPYVFSARGSIPRIVRRQTTKGLFDIVFGRRILADASKLIALSGAEGRQYELMGGDPSKVSVVFNGIDMKAYSTLPPRGVFARRYGIEGKRLITYIGRLNARKGLMPMLRAFKEISMETEDTVLVLVGPDEGYRAHLEKASRNLGISERVVFTGFLTGQDRLAAFADSDVVVYPAEHEAFGLVPFEALACGRPVVVSDDSGCGEIIRMASAGFTVPIQDIRRLAAAIIAAANNSPGVEEQIERGKLFLTDRLNWRTVAVELEQVYREAVSKSPKVAIADA